MALLFGLTKTLPKPRSPTNTTFFIERYGLKNPHQFRTISDVRFLILLRCLAREKESEGKRRRVEDSRPEILAHPGLSLGRKVAGKFRQLSGDEPRHLVFVPDAPGQESSLHPGLSYLAHRQTPFAAVPLQGVNQLPNSLAPRQPFAATSSRTIIRGW